MVAATAWRPNMPSAPRLLAEYVVKMKDAQAYLNEGDLDNSAARRADGES
jgi:hypothetical protein